MRLLISIFTDSFIIWSRNFSLVYILLFGFFLISLFIPKELGSGSESHLLLLFVILGLMMSAFTAGWLNMIAAACRRYFERRVIPSISPTETLKESISLFRFFLSGVSLHFISVVANFIVTGAVFLLLSLTLHPLLNKALPILRQLLESNAQPTPQDLLGLPAEQQALISQLSLSFLQILFIFAAFNLLIALWPAYVTQYRDNLFSAYWHSLKRFFKDPIRFLLIAGLFIGSQFLFPLLSAIFSGNLFVGTIVQLSGLLLSIYLMIVLFVYAYKTSDRPLCVEESDDEEAPDKSDAMPPSDEDSDYREPPLF